MKKKSVKILSLILVILTLVVPMTVLTSCNNTTTETKTTFNTLQELSGKKIGVVTGTIFDQFAYKHLEKPVCCYYNTTADLCTALNNNKVDALILDLPVARAVSNRYYSYKLLATLEDDVYAAVFNKDNERSIRICNEFNEFLNVIKGNGLYSEIESIWFGTDYSKQVINLNEVKDGVNGVIKVVAPVTNEPLAFVKDNEIVGFDIALIYEFCKEYGYSLNVTSVDFAALIPSIESNVADIAIGGISVTDERKESVLFSDPLMDGGVVVVVKDYTKSKGEYLNLCELEGKTVASLTGSVYDSYLLPKVNVSIDYYDSTADQVAALRNNKVDAILNEGPTISAIMKQDPSITVINESVGTCDYAFAFQKSQNGSLLLSKFNNFIELCRLQGILSQLELKWFGDDDSAKTILDYKSLPNINGKIIASTDASFEPLSYVMNGKNVGFETEILYLFCESYGYALELKNIKTSAYITEITSGNSDITFGAIIVSDERKENVNFSSPSYKGNISVAIRSTNYIIEKSKSSIIESFEKTFIRENRWKLFLDGIFNTLLITVLSILVGTFFGMLIYFIFRKNFAIFNYITRFTVWLVQGLPVVVLLMILYYLVFSNSGLNELTVSIICFSLLFSCEVFGLIKNSVETIDKGQNEAALSLGFSERHSLFKILLPQALRHFLPTYKTSILSHIKLTSIVGFIAVQDLTKICDIVRSRTYEAFFPLIATALIYIAIEALLLFIVKRLTLSTDPHKRSINKILRGVETKHDRNN